MIESIPSRSLKPALLALFLLTTSGSGLAREFHYESLTDLASDTRKVDILWSPPDDGEGPWPAILFVHGYQGPDPITGIAPGARAMLETPPRYPLFNIFRSKGFLVAAVSQAGYGNTDGPLDFCGPLSQQAIATAVAALRRNPAVRGDQVFLHGRSRGAVASSMAATRNMGIAGVILESGVYDMKSEYANLLRKNVEPYISIAANIEREAGTSDEGFIARSILLTDLSIPVPVLLLHGMDDSNTPVGHAVRLEKHLTARGGDVSLVTFEGEGHHVPVASTEPEIDAFIARVINAPYAVALATAYGAPR